MNQSSPARRALSGLSFLLLAAVVAVASFLNTPAPPVPELQMPDSVLLQLRGDDRHALVNFVILDAGQTWLPLPPGLVLRPGIDPLTLGEAADDLNLTLAGDLLGQRLDTEIAESWQVDRLALLGLVDAAGGVELLPDADQALSLNGVAVAQVRAGKSASLTGLGASLYAVSGQGRTRVARFLQVWRAVLAKTDAAFLPDLLTGLGSSSRSTMPQEELVQFFEKLQLYFASDRVEVLNWTGPLELPAP